jgi:hypothetical protein
MFKQYSVAIGYKFRVNYMYVCFGFFKEISHFIAACPTLICGRFLLQIFKTAVTYFAARWRL